MQNALYLVYLGLVVMVSSWIGKLQSSDSPNPTEFQLDGSCYLSHCDVSLVFQALHFGNKAEKDRQLSCVYCV